MDLLSAEHIRAGLDTKFIGRPLVFLRQTGSTNIVARRLAEAGAPDGTLVIADYQTAGRGRLDRRWDAPPGSSLLMSLVFRPDLGPDRVQWLTMLCGLAVVDAIMSETGLTVALKWPNDIVLGGSKVGGILTETELSGNELGHVVVGIGLNVNLEPDQLPDHLLADATSLSHGLGRQVPRLPLLLAFLRAVEARYEELKSGLSPLSEWANRLVTLGQQVSVTASDSVLEGMVEGVDPSGALLVRLDNGRQRRIVAGDVTLRANRGRDAGA